MPILIKGSGGKPIKFVTITVQEAAGNQLRFFYYDGDSLALKTVSNRGTIKVPKSAICRAAPIKVNTSYRFTVTTGDTTGEIFEPQDDPNFCFLVPYDNCTLNYG